MFAHQPIAPVKLAGPHGPIPPSAIMPTPMPDSPSPLITATITLLPKFMVMVKQPNDPKLSHADRKHGNAPRGGAK